MWVRLQCNFSFSSLLGDLLITTNNRCFSACGVFFLRSEQRLLVLATDTIPPRYATAGSAARVSRLSAARPEEMVEEESTSEVATASQGPPPGLVPQDQAEPHESNDDEEGDDTCLFYKDDGGGSQGPYDK